MKKIFLFLFCCVCALSSYGQITPNLYKSVDKIQMTHWVDSVFDAMSYNERIGQLFMIVGDPDDNFKNMQKLVQLVNDMKVGGILFHGGDLLKQAVVTNRLQKDAHIPMLVALDGEWGLAMRLSGTTRFPKNMMLGAVNNMALLTEYGKEVGRQCKEMGIQINFAPDMDVNSNWENPVIGIRSFGENASAVAKRGIAYSRGLEEAGVLSVAKHFPGHGDTNEDSHVTLPVVRHDMANLEKVELLPFQQFIQEGFGGVMTGHLYVPAIDSSVTPTSLSYKTVTGLLKEKLHFEGLCFTDALEMKGVTTSTSDNPCVRALLAGNDILLAPGDPLESFNAVKTAIDSGVLKLADMEARCLKVLQYKYVLGLNHYQPINTRNLSDRLNSPHAAWLASKLNEEAITVVKNVAGILPVQHLDKKRIATLAIGEVEGNPFQKMLNRYDSVTCYSLLRTATALQTKKVYAELNNYDLIICSVHGTRIPESKALGQLVQKKNVVFVFFTLPYYFQEYRTSLQRAKAVVMAYEATTLSQEYAAQTLFGGIAARGILPVSVPKMFASGTGFNTIKNRLGYHEPEEVGLSAARLHEIDDIVAEGLEKKAFPGCQVLVAKDGMIVYSKSFGHFDYEKKQAVNENAVYDLASCSKASGTLLAVMHSYDLKHFRLNNKISYFLPELRNSNKKNITIKDMLYHQSGLTPSILFYADAIDKNSYEGPLISSEKDAEHPIHFDSKVYVRNDFTYLPEYISNVKKPGFTLAVAKNMYVSDSFKKVIMRDIKESQLSNAGKYVYSDLNFILLKWMVEAQMHVPMDKMLHHFYFSRLGAWHTTYNPLKEMNIETIAPTEDDRFVRCQLLRGYVHDEAAAFQGGVSGNAGLFTNANDMAKLLQLYLNSGTYGGERFLSTETCRLFTQSKCPTSRRGLGFDKPAVGDPDNSPCGRLTPASVYGHTGYTGTCFWVDPDNKLIYIFLSNRVNPTRMNGELGSLNIRTRIQDTIYKAMQ